MPLINFYFGDYLRKIDIATVIVLLTALTAFITALYSIYHSRKTVYINAITTSRLKYIENLRSYVSEFCGLVQIDNDSTEKNQKVDRLRFSKKLHLNRKDEFNIKVLELLDKIPNYSDHEKRD